MTEPDYRCCVCGKPGNWGDCCRTGFRMVANAIGHYACSEVCDLLAAKAVKEKREKGRCSG